MMVKLVISNNGSEEEAKDVYQEAFIVFWQKAVGGNFTLTSKISTYLYSICLNLWRKELTEKESIVTKRKTAPNILKTTKRKESEL